MGRVDEIAAQQITHHAAGQQHIVAQLPGDLYGLLAQRQSLLRIATEEVVVAAQDRESLDEHPIVADRAGQFDYLRGESLRGGWVIARGPL